MSIISPQLQHFLNFRYDTSMAATTTTVNLHPLLERIHASKRIPNAILTYGENSMSLLNQFITFSNTINNCTCQIPDDNESELIEPATDVILIQPKTTIKIDLIKQIQERIKYGASNSGYCIVILHNCHKMTQSAANALLKSIEEPQENTLFLLSTTHREQLPKTILSRCHKLFIPESTGDAEKRQNELINQISESIDYINCQTFINLPIIDKIAFIQGLPFNQNLVSDILTAWQTELAVTGSTSKKEQLFLKKIIEIIKNIKYNLNLKLQLLAATLVLEEDANGTPR